MKKLSDYKDEEALDLWVDLLDPLTDIFTDPKVQKVVGSGAARLVIAKELLKLHRDSVVQILLRIDPAPLNGLNIITRLVGILAEIGSNDEVKGFFGYVAQEKTGEESSGSVTENTEAEEQ